VWAYCGEEGQVIVHRLLAGRRGGFIFKGDGSARPDRPIEGEVLIGRVVEIERHAVKTRLGRRDRLLRGLPRCLMFQAGRIRRWAVRTARKWMIGRNAIDDDRFGD
jgi:hypothetical protein